MTPRRVTPLAFIFQFHSPQGRSLKLWKRYSVGATNGGDKRKRIHTGKSQRGERERERVGTDAGGKGEAGSTGERGELISIATYYHLSPYQCNGRAAPIINP